MEVARERNGCVRRESNVTQLDCPIALSLLPIPPRCSRRFKGDSPWLPSLSLGQHLAYLTMHSIPFVLAALLSVTISSAAADDTAVPDIEHAMMTVIIQVREEQVIPSETTYYQTSKLTTPPTRPSSSHTSTPNNPPASTRNATNTSTQSSPPSYPRANSKKLKTARVPLQRYL